MSKYSRRQYKVSVTYHLPTVPYFKKMPSKTVPFYSAGCDAILLLYAIRIEGRVKFQVDFSSLFYRSVLPTCFLVGRSAPVYRLFLLFSSINRFSSGQVRSSPSTELFLLL